MRSKTKNTAVARSIAIIGLVLLVSGCTTAGKAKDWITGRSGETSSEPAGLSAPSAETYLRELQELAAGDAATRAGIVADASSAAQLTPGPSTNLRLALVLGTPGHADSDPERAQGLLQDVLASPELLTEAELSLATVQLNVVERLIVSSNEVRSQQQASNRRLANAKAENQRLLDELAEAEQKLEAITTIERSIREQE
jgi:hypothetical protein